MDGLFYRRYQGEPFEYDFGQVIAAAGSNKIHPKLPIFNSFLQRLGPYVSNNTPNILFQAVNRWRRACWSFGFTSYNSWIL